jgi:ABC-type polysaccharide transport system permease subunit
MRKSAKIAIGKRPGVTFFSYLPLVGTVAAFKQYRFNREGFWASIYTSKWAP